MGIFQARILEWVAMPSSRGSSQPRDRTQVSCIADGFFIIWVTREHYSATKKRSDVQMHLTPWTNLRNKMLREW